MESLEPAEPSEEVQDHIHSLVALLSSYGRQGKCSEHLNLSYIIEMIHQRVGHGQQITDQNNVDFVVDLGTYR